MIRREILNVKYSEIFRIMTGYLLLISKMYEKKSE
jgi:hypothetical protein